MSTRTRSVAAGYPRTLVGLSDVAGHLSSLAAGLRTIGVDARFHNLSANPLAHGGSPSRAGRLMALRYAPAGSARQRIWNLLLRANRVVRRLRAAALFPWALWRYDAFVLGGHETFLGGMDLWILRRLGKRVVVTFTGSDHRPPYLSGIGVRDFPDDAAMAAHARRLSRRVRAAERGATAIVALPASAQLHRRPFVDFLSLGIPFVPPAQLELSGPLAGSSSERPVRILHSPTEPGPKGTAEIRDSITRCRADGLRLEYRELIGVPNVEVLRALTWCDFVIDEVYSDTPMAKFATEAAFYGKPAVVGSYAAPLYAAWSRPVPPVHMCRPEDLDDGVRMLITDEEYRVDLGRRAREFVLREWSPEAVAERMLAVIIGEIPADWIVRPTDVGYIHGWGVREEVLREVLRRLIDGQGIDALQLPPESPAMAAILELVATCVEAGAGD